MNIQYTITWPDPQNEQPVRRFYNALRAGVARAYSKPDGARFPFDSPYEVGLVRGLGEPAQWSVMVLAVDVAADEAAGGADTLPALQAWIGQTAPDGLPSEAAVSAGPAAALKLSSELGADFEVVDSFGTFVGEPTLEDLPPEPAAPAGEAPPSEPAEPPEPGEAALEAAPPTPPAEEPAQSAEVKPVLALPAAASPAPPRPAPPAKTGISKELTTCLRLFLIGTGILLLPASLMMAAFLSIGQFGEPTAETVSTGEYLVLLLCCPAPLLLLGAGLIVFGALLPKMGRDKR